MLPLLSRSAPLPVYENYVAKLVMITFALVVIYRYKGHTQLIIKQSRMYEFRYNEILYSGMTNSNYARN